MGPRGFKSAEQQHEMKSNSMRLEPKLIAPFKPQPGKPPRRIAIERTKRLYKSQNVEELLKQQGVDYQLHAINVDHETGKNSFLPLQIFDDTEFEPRNPEEWAQLGTNEEGVCCVPAKGLRLGPDNKGSFIPCEMVEYRAEDNIYVVRWTDTKELDRLHRIFLCFETEDPYIFAKRVIAAHRSRREFESMLRYSLYVDSMPTDEISPLDNEQVSRILSLALNTEAMRQSALDTSALLTEVNIDFARTLNKIVFDKSINDPSQKSLKSQLQLCLREEKESPVPQSGVFQIPQHDFPKHYSDFCFNSFYTKPEAIDALRIVTHECLEVLEMRLFNTHFTKSLRLDEFEQQQSSSIAQLHHFLKETWSHSLKSAVKTSLKDVGKGWFNLQEKNREVYMFSKLKKFMNRVNFLMEDSVRYLVQDSLNEYRDLINRKAKYEVTVTDTNDVSVNLREGVKQTQDNDDANDDDSEREEVPLFRATVTVREGKVTFKKELDDFVSVPIAMLEKGLSMVQNVPQLESSVMEHLFWYGGESKMNCVQRGEDWVQELESSIRTTLEEATIPLREYLELFSKYNEFLSMDIDQYITEHWTKDDFTIDDIKKEINSHFKEIEKIEKHIPSTIWLGVAQVSCEEVQRLLILKHQQIIQKELSVFAQLTKSRCIAINTEFFAIERELKTTPEDIEALTQMKKYMETVPSMLAMHKGAIAFVLESFVFMDEFKYKYTADMFRLRWQIFGWNKTIADLLERQRQILDNQKTSFLDKMRVEQGEFASELQDVESKVQNFGQYTDVKLMQQMHDKVNSIQEQISSLTARSREFNNNESLFELDCSDYRSISTVSKSFEPYHQLWTTLYKWSRNAKKWKSDSFKSLDPDLINEEVNEYGKTLVKILKHKTVKANIALSEVATKYKSEVESFKPLLPLISALRNPGMRERHWESLSEKLPFEFQVEDSTTLTSIVEEFKLQDHMEVITKVGDVAGKEYQIESALDKMEAAWESVEFEVCEYKETKTYVVKGVDEVIVLLDEHIVMTQAMQFSAFKKHFEDRITSWDKKLRLVSEVIEEWLAVQRQWLSLQPIFASPDINKQLPAEGKRFANVNKTWRLIMSQVHSSPHVLAFCDSVSLLQKLQEANKMLDLVQKRLSDYLDQKRASFARFYFLSNDELLQILSQTQDPTAVQPHLKKCFDNIDRLEFTENQEIVAMYSAKKEKVPFTTAIATQGRNVENWLGDVQEEMKHTLVDVMKDAIADYPTKPRTQWVRDWCGQAVLNGSQFHWTKDVEEALAKDGLEGIKAYHKFLISQLMDMVELVRSDLTKVERITMGALIVLDVHARDVLERLVEESVSSPNDFGWICQMRYYMNEMNMLQVQMVQSIFPYGYEYLGNTDRLVITPLTDRCYMTLMAALQLHLGGAPAGPAGTGKTETVKDLAKAVAKQCVVFNCSDGLDYLAMGKFFKGLASSGAWACFDEFNRIDIEVLSVVAQQIMTIWAAVREGVDHFVFEGTDIRLEPTCSVFITMNPGYAGRTELPDNLAALFRPVAMMVPDYALIAEISMYSFGFNNAKTLARKMVATFRLSSEQLSAQDHYDYGMRAVKTVITRAGILKREEPESDEAVLVLRALRDVNVPKFLKDDLPLFEGIISDLFPGITKPENDYGALMNSIILTAQEEKLQPEDAFLDKCIQLYETTVVRHGLMLVGPTGGGKTSTLRTLANALTRVKDLPGYCAIETTTVNPKSVTMGQLYGEFDENTHEWTDGILANIVRQCIEDERDTKKWVVFDGPVDAIWIENMNTVLDDNKKLCLVSGEILQLTSDMTMIFEVEDLAVASPATVSRCGMVYMEPTALGMKPLTTSWTNSLAAVFADIVKPIHSLFDALLEPCIEFIRKNCSEPVPTVDNNLAQSLMTLLECQLQPFIPREGRDVEEEEIALVKKHIEPMFIFSLIWSVGATTDKAGRQKFNQYLRLLLHQSNIKEPIPERGSVYDYTYDLKNETWRGWMDGAELYQFDVHAPFSEIIVPTIDSVRYTHLLDLLVSNNKHPLVTGNTGTGKTVNVQQYLSTMPAKLVPINVTFSAATSANQTEEMLYGKMEKRRKNVYGAPLGKRFVIFVDDLNMPAREKYFAQPPIELLRQWMDHKGWYDRQSLEFLNIVDISFIGAMGPPGGGRNPVTPRFLRHFNQIAHTELEDDSLRLIFSTIMKGYMHNYAEEIQGMADSAVNANIEIYNTIVRELLPTPSKSHYTFNLRDLSKVFQGMLNASARHVTEPDCFLRLWVHENRRVFQDRLVCNEDRQWLDTLMAKLTKTHFESEWDTIMDGHDRVLFGDYMGGADTEHREYAEVSDTGKLVTVIEEYLAVYNEEKSPMNLVMFLDAIEHVSRISRILRQPQGNALLLGVGGSGRQSLTKLAAHMAEYNLFQIEIAKNYSKQDWKDDLKSVLMAAGLKEEPTVFLFSDTQIIEESFLEDVNNILNAGDVPSLYSPEDLDNIFVTCKVDCQRKNIPATKLNAFAQYLNRVRRNLHVVLCMSPLGDAFRTRLRMFPALVNCCTIDWFAAWPSEALSSVAMSALTEEELNLNNIPAVVKMFQHIHLSVEKESVDFKEKLMRYNYVTPTSYLELLSIFKTLLKKKRDQVGSLKNKLQNGLNKLEFAAKNVAELQVELTDKQPVLKKTQKEVDEMMVEIAKDKEAAAITKEAVEKQEADASAKAAECKEIRDDAQADLDKALPLLDQAVQCLSELKKNDIEEVRSMKKPPSGVRLTMEAACIMLKKKPTMKNDPTQVGKKIADYWETAQKDLLKDAKLLLTTLKDYDKDNIPDATIKKISPYIDREDFQVEAIEKASKACKAVCMWVHAMYNYYHVSREVEPKRLRLKGAESQLAVVEAALKEAKDKLAAVEDRIRILTEKYERAVLQQENLKHEVEMCQVKLGRAEKLIGGLGGEKTRWEQTVKKLEVDFENIVGDVLVSAGTISYLGAFTNEYRQKLTANWRQTLKDVDVPHSEGTDVRSTLANAVEIREWNICGLPTDAISVENGIIMSNSRRWPLMIDPQGQASKFIKSMGAKKFEDGMSVLKLSDKNFLRTLENAIRFGKWVLIENIHEELDPALEPLLLQQLNSVNGQPHIKLGDNNVPYNDNFRLYITTKLPNPHYAPELQVKVTLLNFTITPQGLQDQMLGTVVAKESPAMEQKKNALVVQNAQMKAELQSIEDQILKLLSESSGDILEDEQLIDTLSQSKKTSAEIEERVLESAEVEKEIDEARKAYEVVAVRASILYFTIADLAMIDPMYQYSLQWFVNLFVGAIEQAPPSDDLNVRLTTLNDYFTKSLYENVCRSLFETHKTLFSFLLTVRILQGDSKIDMVEWRFLVAGAATSKQVVNPDPSWVTDAVWSSLLSLSDLESFAGFEQSFSENTASYRAIFDSVQPQNVALPEPWNSKLDMFQKLLVLKCLRPDKLIEAIQSFVAANLGQSFIESPPFDIEYSFRAANNVTPLIFILSKGADPASELFAFAGQTGFRDKMTSISLGQGQGQIAQKHIEAAKENGGWVLLQNCHLAVSWLPKLEKICEDMNPDEVHPDFRLWLTSMPTKKFPVSILQNGVKITNEPPTGLRANLMRSYLGFSDQMLNDCSKPDEFKKLLFSLCFFHAVILDRRKFGPLGWNIPYGFTENDLQVCITQLREFLNMYDEVPYKVIHFLTYDINYGGRVTDDVDRRTICTILDDFVNSKVLEDGYKFSPSGDYTSITAGTRDQYLDTIKSYPMVPGPEVFGLHDNADITSAQEATHSMLSTIVQLMPRSSAGGGKSREEIMGETAASILARLPQQYDIEGISKKYPTVYEESMNTVLVQEAIRYNKLIDVMHSTLEDVQKALKGEMVMTQVLEEISISLFNNTVPETWANVAYPSLMPLASWVNDLVERLSFIQGWVDNGIPDVFWISGFFFPQAFLTGTLQNFARKHVKPIDTVSFSFEILDTPHDEITSKPEDGIYIRGLFLEGARWDKESKSLVESRAKELFTAMPVVWLRPIVNREVPKTGVYKCPVYKILTRRGQLSTTGHSTNFVQFIEIPTSEDASKWVKAGVALFCSLRY